MNDQNENQIKYNGEDLDQETTHKYLGSVVTDDEKLYVEMANNKQTNKNIQGTR